MPLGPYAPGRAPAAQLCDFVAVMEASGEFSTLLGAFEEAEPVDLLRDGGRYTLFAPTDAALDALPDGVLEQLLEDGERLKTVLEHHIVDGPPTLAHLLIAGEVQTLSDHEIEIDDLSVERADVQAGKGLFHVVDEVMSPPMF